MKISKGVLARPQIPEDLLVLITRYMMGDLSLLDMNAISASLTRAPHDKLLQDYLYLPVSVRSKVAILNQMTIKTTVCG